MATVAPFRASLFAAGILFAALCHPATSLAFHSGGVGSCEGCHGLHQGNTGQSTSAWMLLGSDPSSTCLRCHADPTNEIRVLSEDGSSYTPGGDFHWLKESFSWSGEMGQKTSIGDRHGHNVVAADFQMSADGQLSVAPGGSYPSSKLGCTSCHDPHGKPTAVGTASGPVVRSGSYGGSAPNGTVSGTFRLLRGASTGADAFSNAAPVAVAPLRAVETDQNHVAYGSGMSEWCANCHAGILNNGDRGVHRHVAGNDAKLGRSVVAIYNSYVKSGDLTGSAATAYSALVPFELGTSDVTSLNPTSTDGPSSTSANVMCLSCHRAHASAFSSAGRWDFKATFLADSHPGPSSSGGSNRHAYYGRDIVSQFGPYQRSLCNKCHAQD